MTKKIHKHEGKKYLRTIHSPEGDSSVEADIYAVLEAFGVTCPARAHAIKKLLCCGGRGKGDALADLLGAEAAVSRAIELQRVREIVPSPGVQPPTAKPKLPKHFAPVYLSTELSKEPTLVQSVPEKLREEESSKEEEKPYYPGIGHSY